jgi:ACDE family multidrug resistance protein
MGSGSALYVGELLGSFGTLIPIAMYPELRETFEISEGGVPWAMTAYLVPMTILLFVSGTLGEKFERRRVARAVFVVYAFASLTVALPLGECSWRHAQSRARSTRSSRPC